jgi:hypothetical protein
MGPDGETLFYSVERLWALSASLPVKTIPITQVESELDYPYQWFKTTKPSPREVAKHAKKIFDADLDYPIILSASGLVMDGLHRIAKCWLLGIEHIKAVKFTEDPEPDRVRWPAEVSKS